VPLWLSWLNTMCEQTIPSMYLYSTRYIKQVKNMNNKNMQDVRQVRDRESNYKHGRFVSRFEHTSFMSPPSTLWRIFTKNRSHQITRCNTYKRVYTRTPLDSLVPPLFLQEQHTSSTQAYRGHFQRAELSGGWSPLQPNKACTFCARRSTGRPTSSSVDRAVDRQKPKQYF